jgi:hypothetical protein
MCSSLAFLSDTDNTSSFFPIFLVGFDKKIMQVCGNIMGPRSWESFQGPLARCQVRLLISFSGIGLLFMEDYASLLF